MAYKDPDKQRESYRKRHAKKKDDPDYKQRRKEYEKRYRETHKAEYQAYHREWARKNKDKLKAKFAKWYAENKERNIATRRVWQEKNREHLAEYNQRPDVVARRNDGARKFTILMRELVLAEYGGQCACCGEKHVQFLTIDHTDGNGNQHRKELGMAAGKSFYLWLRRNGFPKDGYRILCMNCNWSRGVYGFCPHVKA